MNGFQMMTENFMKINSEFRNVLETNKGENNYTMNDMVDNLKSETFEMFDTLKKNKKNINKIQALRSSAIQRQIDANKDLLEDLKKRINAITKTLGKSMGYNGANGALTNTAIHQVGQEVRNLTFLFSRMQDSINCLNDRVIQMKKKLVNNRIKPERVDEKEANKDKDDERRSQNKKDKSKGEGDD
jgi:hypothetical protein